MQIHGNFEGFPLKSALLGLGSIILTPEWVMVDRSFAINSSFSSCT